MLMATRYVRVGTTVYTRGEALPKLPEEKKKWLLSCGAAVEMSLPGQKEPEEEIEEEIEEVEEAAEEPDEEAEDEDVSDVLNIDVMSAIVKPAKKGGRK